MTGVVAVTDWIAHAVAIVAEGPDVVPRPLWELLLIWLGAFTTFSAAALIAWKVARPHVEAYVRSVVKPLQETANQVHAQVTPNSGSSAHDYAKKAFHAASEAKASTDTLLSLTTRNVRKIDSLTRQVTEVDRKLKEHVDVTHAQD